MAKNPPVPKENLARIRAAEALIVGHPLLGFLASLARVSHAPKTPFPKTGWARNSRVKTIVDPSLAVEPMGAHLFKVQPGHALVTEEMQAHAAAAVNSASSRA